MPLKKSALSVAPNRLLRSASDIRRRRPTSATSDLKNVRRLCARERALSFRGVCFPSAQRTLRDRGKLNFQSQKSPPEVVPIDPSGVNKNQWATSLVRWVQFEPKSGKFDIFK